MRSASVEANTFATALLQPTNYYRDISHRLLESPSVAPAENVASQMFLHGLAIQMGSESVRGKALLHRHFLWNQTFREGQYQQAASDLVHYEICR